VDWEDCTGGVCTGVVTQVRGGIFVNMGDEIQTDHLFEFALKCLGTISKELSSPSGDQSRCKRLVCNHRQVSHTPHVTKITVVRKITFQ
jgi:hypothetical protein